MLSDNAFRAIRNYLFIILCIFILGIYGVAHATLLYYSGSMDAVFDVTEALEISLPSGITGFTYNYPIGDNVDYCVNSQVIDSRIFSFTHQPVVTDMFDEFGNPYKELFWSNPPSAITATITYTVNTASDWDGFNTRDLFPLTDYLIPQDVAVFLEPTAYTQSEDPNLVSLSHSLTTGLDKEWEAVYSICKWVINNITYGYNPGTDALSTYSTRIGVCSNYSHLACALLRASGIPARFVGGYALSRPFSLPYNGGTTSIYWNQESHAWLEVYYPSLGWVPYEPQRDFHIIDTHRIRHGAGKDKDLAFDKYYITYSVPPGSFTPPAKTLNVNWVSDTINVAYQKKDEGINRLALSPSVHFTPPLSAPSDINCTFENGNISVTWAPNTDPDLAGYRVHWDTDSGHPYEYVVDAGDVTSCAIPVLSTSDTQYITVTAYDSGYSSLQDDPNTRVNENQAFGNESLYAQEDTIQIPYYTITGTVAGVGGSMDPLGAIIVSYGEDKTFTITPYQDYHIACVKVDGSPVGTMAEYIFSSVDADHSIEVLFSPDNIRDVGSGYTYASIQAAIDSAQTGDCIIVHDGTYHENIDFGGKVLTVYSENGRTKTLIDGNASGPVVTFDQNEGPDSVLKGFTIMNGNGEKGGGIYCLDSSPTIIDCYIKENTASICGGGIYFYNTAGNLFNCIFQGNTADGAPNQVFLETVSSQFPDVNIIHYDEDKSDFMQIYKPSTGKWSAVYSFFGQWIGSAIQIQADDFLFISLFP